MTCGNLFMNRFCAPCIFFSLIHPPQVYCVILFCRMCECVLRCIARWQLFIYIARSGAKWRNEFSIVADNFLPVIYDTPKKYSYLLRDAFISLAFFAYFGAVSLSPCVLLSRGLSKTMKRPGGGHNVIALWTVINRMCVCRVRLKSKKCGGRKRADTKRHLNIRAYASKG